jgi:hypothetical protein
VTPSTTRILDPDAGCDIAVKATTVLNEPRDGHDPQ